MIVIRLIACVANLCSFSIFIFVLGFFAVQNKKLTRILKFGALC